MEFDKILYQKLIGEIRFIRKLYDIIFPIISNNLQFHFNRYYILSYFSSLICLKYVMPYRFYLQIDKYNKLSG